MKNIFISSLVLFSVLSMGCGSSQKKTESQDPFLWLEDIYGTKQLEWVKAHNEKSFKALGDDPRYAEVKDEAKKIIAAPDRIPWVSMSGDKFRNFWMDEKHPRGIWRETTLAEYKKKNPKWDVLLDIDALNKSEKKSWTFKGSSCLPQPQNFHCLVYLSDGGKDKSVMREFNTRTKKFVKDGFVLPEAKNSVSWKDLNTVYLGTDLGEDTVTESGYPRQVRLWKRGTAFEKAPVIFEGVKKDVSVFASKSFYPGSKLSFAGRGLSTFEQEIYMDSGDGKWKKLPFPVTATFQGEFKNYLFVSLREDWHIGRNTFTSGSLLAIPLAKVFDANFADHLETVFVPTKEMVFSWLSQSKDYLFLGVLNNVRNESYRISLVKDKWIKERFPSMGTGTLTLSDSNDYDNRIIAAYVDFNVPSSLYYGDATNLSGMTKLKSSPERYDGKSVIIDQYFSTSSDGVKIPYFVIRHKDVKFDGSNPTLMYGYGGFEYALTPSYLTVAGKLWLEKGGVYVLTNIRGGGEYGPQWHAAGILANRQKVYDDFYSITQDLFKRGITKPARLGIMGGSNGGLLTGVAFTQHPEYYKAVISEAPLLDMIRYTKLPPGASWMGEYGDPDDAKMREVILKYSPYQNIKAGQKYPLVFFYTSTADDRVQPGHARKMVARMESLGYSVLLYENTEGGHGGAADIEQSAKKIAMQYIYLYQELMDPR